MAKTLDEEVKEMGKEVKDEVDLDDIQGKLEIARKESAGKDAKISEQRNVIRDLQARLGDKEEGGAEIEKNLDALREMTGELKARAKLMDQQEEALKYAIKKGVPIDLAVKNADDLESFDKSINVLADKILAGFKESVRGNPKPLWDTSVKKGEGLTLAQVQKMDRKELREVPDHILQRLMEGK